MMLQGDVDEEASTFIQRKDSIARQLFTKIARRSGYAQCIDLLIGQGGGAIFRKHCLPTEAPMDPRLSGLHLFPAQLAKDMTTAIEAAGVGEQIAAIERIDSTYR
ncbi:hypothetical protein CI15_20290 [Paraburkholderia monticola]|uniref:Uncharacterized protein n=1 Tax=Paraburkholderia monticola TaxID=1399968 RepID=A0A149PKT6_9BURK|nr:hypothetical protein [Paraburkholderia monticola]KXU85506.1 hypothetical protein CI15_20290 [Paraburkholderia monticola]